MHQYQTGLASPKQTVYFVADVEIFEAFPQLPQTHSYFQPSKLLPLPPLLL